MALGLAEVGLDFGPVAPELQGAAEEFDGLLGLALVQEGQAGAGEDVGVVRREADGLAVLVEGLGVLS